jgi:hypothetical protein
MPTSAARGRDWPLQTAYARVLLTIQFCVCPGQRACRGVGCSRIRPSLANTRSIVTDSQLKVKAGHTIRGDRLAVAGLAALRRVERAGRSAGSGMRSDTVESE